MPQESWGEVVERVAAEAPGRSHSATRDRTAATPGARPAFSAAYTAAATKRPRSTSKVSPVSRPRSTAVRSTRAADVSPARTTRGWAACEDAAPAAYQVLKISDFGLSELNPIGLSGTYCGSPLYAAPELMTEGATPHGYEASRSDIWSCGIVLYELLLGDVPWSEGGESTGAMPLGTPQLLALSKLFYGGRAAPGFERRDRDALRRGLDDAGLTGEFWELP